jgi:hypothetical protein
LFAVYALNNLWFLTMTMDALCVCCVLQRYMDSEIMAIMAQYMPLDSQHSESQPLRTQEAQHA